MKKLTINDFKIANEKSIVDFDLVPKSEKVKSILFYDPTCRICKMVMLTAECGVDVLESPLLTGFFGVLRVPTVIKIINEK